MSDTATTTVKTPAQAKKEADALARQAEKDQVDAQVAEDQAVLDQAKARQKTAIEAKAKADADLVAALDAIADAQLAEAAAAAENDPATIEEAQAESAKLAFAAIKAHAEADTAAKNKLKADEAVVAAHEKLLDSTVKQASLKPVTDESPWHYCLETGHATDLKHHTRFFQSDDAGCPVCPSCRRQVSAVPADAFGVYPPGILAVHERLTKGV
jgi:hypothetical protein